MDFKYIDIHSHLGFSDYGVDQAEVVNRMKENRVATITIGTTLEDSREAVKIAGQYDNVFACIGVHPKERSEPVFNEKEFEKLIVHPKVVAIGECGLDYFKLEGDPETIVKIKDQQKKVFIQQIEFGIKYNKPLMIHTRDSYEDVYEILNSYRGKVRGNLHSFDGGVDWAQKFIDLGFTLSFTGALTYSPRKNFLAEDSARLEVVKICPLDMVHAETDAPFLAPVPYRGKRNEPSYVIEVIRKIAEIRGEGVEKVREQLLENSKNFFNLS